MARQTETLEDAKQQLWTQLSRGRTSMLAVAGSGQHPQPMTHFADEDGGAIWFITSSDTDLARAIGTGGRGQLCFMSKNEDYFASIEGALEVSQNNAKLDEYWSVAAAAWFEQGREDPKVTLLKFTPAEAAVWANESSAVLVGLKLLRAGLKEGESNPDVGVHHVLQMNNG
ncbi:pyridoxamine 5'-phosphate oxidase family protein [Cribrihabitans neustonicus]|uniref:pyridoxamine 5'-phosphate oxidase family protein n=1 Tax=Cribrihabitans neustonicus TaxID=1429085 RepID=UPI003B5B0B61